MGEVLVLLGGGVWLAVTLVMVGYTTVLAVAREWRAMSVSLSCTVFVLFLGWWVLVNAERIAQSFWF